MFVSEFAIVVVHECNTDATSHSTMAVSDVMLLVSDPKISGTSVVLPAESTSATAPITLSWNTLNPRRCFFLRRMPAKPIWSATSVPAPVFGVAFHKSSSSFPRFHRASNHART